MKKMLRSGFVLLAAFGAGLVTCGALAASDPHTYTFSFNTATDIDDGSVLDYHTGGLNGPTAFFGTNGNGGLVEATVSAWRINTDLTNTDVSEYIERWSSGLGVEQPDSVRNGNSVVSYENEPWHGVDNNPSNCRARYSSYCDTSGSVERAYTGEEFLVFDFGTDDEGKDLEVSLHSFLFGYAAEKSATSGFDAWADATVLRGVGGPGYDLNSSLSGNKATSAAGGFSLVGNYENVPDANLGDSTSIANDAQTTPGSGYSRYWAIGTLLTNLLDTPNSFDHLFEGAKLAQITVKTRKPSETPPGETPVPATVLLLAAGFLCMRKQRAGT